MKFSVLTLFPESLEGVFSSSILGRAQKKGSVEINLVQIRDFSTDRHKKVDDEPYGGGAGMVMTVQPLRDALLSVLDNNERMEFGEHLENLVNQENIKLISENRLNDENEEVTNSEKLNSEKLKTKVIFTSPRGKVLTQEKCHELSELDHLVVVCGHYEGVDERFIDQYVDEEISIGDYVLTGGEIAALAIVDSVARLKKDVITEDSLSFESHTDGLLEYPQYTRPVEIDGMKVPDVLMSGHHANIEKWRKEQSEKITKERRPDMYDEYLKNNK